MNAKTNISQIINLQETIDILYSKLGVISQGALNDPVDGAIWLEEVTGI